MPSRLVLGDISDRASRWFCPHAAFAAAVWVAIIRATRGLAIGEEADPVEARDADMLKVTGTLCTIPKSVPPTSTG